VGVTRPEAGRRVREVLPRALFLAPGYGVQGGGAAEVGPLLDDRGFGVLVNSSRGILGARIREQARGGSAGRDYRDAARAAARAMRADLEGAGLRP
jgi:orotidine-5'-phosphate decarboxylase